jgi:ATP-binding cassette subfamily B multidrug efflux pump
MRGVERGSDEGDIVRGYSPEVMKRLLGYLKPYMPAMILTIIALTLATGSELLSPIVMRRALDDYVLRREYSLDVSTVENLASGSGQSAEDAAAYLEEGIQISDRLFVAPSVLSDMDIDAKDAAREAGWLDENDWFVYILDSEESEHIILNNPGAFIVDGNGEYAAISIEGRRELAPEERRTLRAADIAGLGRRSVQYLLLLTTVLIFTFAQVYLASWIGQKIMADIRQGLLGHIMRQSLRYLGKTPVGSLVSRTANDVETINEFFSNVTISFLKDFAVMIGVLVVIFALDVRLALISLTTVVPTLFLIVIFRNRMRESFRRVRSRVSAVNAYLSERIGGMGTLQLFDAQRRSAKEFRDKSHGLLKAELLQMRIMAVFRPLIELIASAAVALVIWYSTGLHDRGLVTLGVLIAFLNLIQKFFEPVKDIAEKFNILQSAMAGSERIFDMMDTVDRVPDVQGAGDELPSPKGPKEHAVGRVRFEDVHFSYVPGEPVLRGLNFTIEPGTTVAVVGATGAGKTTIANLMTRLWDSDSGRVLLDEKDIREIPLDRLRRTIQPVQQDVFLFAGTMTENIDLGLGLDSERIIEAARISRADAFIQSLPKGYETYVTEGAGNLSAGQRQLIAFARIIAHDPSVIILDEATANVDTETESLLQEGLEHLLTDRTALIIAHRLSTIRRADRIMVLGHGKLIEEGTHPELLARKGVYHNLYKLQFGQGEKERETAI